jgi:Arc/MetJ-type ribon-helix-helix transcriptional regulator
MAPAGHSAERVTVTMPAELVAGIDRLERNRSRFITDAVRHELKRRQRLELLRSLQEPHPDSSTTAALGLTAWADALPAEASDLVDPAAGVPVRWTPGQGWQDTGA